MQCRMKIYSLIAKILTKYLANNILFYNFVVGIASNIDKRARPKLHLFTFFPKKINN